MPNWQVQPWRDGKSYEIVDAASAKEAAEQLHEGSLSEAGSMHKIRARAATHCKRTERRPT
jgi:hypothetical protein